MVIGGRSIFHRLQEPLQKPPPLVAAPSEDIPTFSVEPTSLDLRDIAPGSEQSTQFTIKNAGSSTIVAALEATKPWLQVTPTNIRLTPGEQVIKVRVDTKGLPYGFTDTGFIKINVTSHGVSAWVTVSLIVTAKPMMSQGTLVFEDDFTNPSSGWIIGSESGAVCGYENGGYRIVVKEADTLIGRDNKQITYLGDFALEIDAKCLSSNEDGICGSYGILFRQQDSENFYFFAIHTGDIFTPGNYCIKKCARNTVTDLIAHTYSYKINKGKSTNHLKVVCQGARITVYVNGYELATVTDYSFPKGDIRLVAWSGSESQGEADVLFDNLKIYVPD
jgi:hypothetical protein